MLDRPKRLYKDLSIRVWLFLLVLIFALPAAGGIAWYAINAQQMARQDADKNVEIIAGNVAANLELLLRDYERLLKAIATEYQGNPPAGAQNFNPGQILHTDPLVIRLGVRDLQANPIFVSWSDGLPASQALKLPWVQQGLHSEVFAVSGAIQEPRSGRWVVVLTYPVRDAQGQRTGFVNLSLDLLTLNERLLATIPTNVIVPVFDSNDQFLLRSFNAQDAIGKPLPQKLADGVRGKISGFVTRSDLKGVARFYAIASIPSAGWRVFAGMSEEEVLAPARQKFRYIVTVGMTVLLLLMALAWQMAQAIARPVRNLAETAKKIVIGDENARAAVDGPSEVAEVAQEFNHMLDARKLAEQKLVERESLLLESQRVGRIGSYVMDLVADAWRSSLVFDQIFGIAPQDARSTASWNALVHPDDRAGMLRYFQHDVLEARKPFDREYRIVRASDGETRWVWGLGELSFNQHGDPLSMIGTIQDITDRKQAEFAIRKREDEFRNLIDHLQVGVVVHAPDTSVLMANQVAISLLGLSLAQMQGKMAIDLAWHFVCEDESPMSVQDYPVAQVAATRQPLTNFIGGIRRPGAAGLVWAQINAYPEFDDQQALQQIVVSFADITELKEAEKLACRSQMMLERTERIAHTGSWEWNPKTDAVTWSAETHRFFGRDAALGAPNFSQQQQLFTPEDSQRLAEVLAQAMADGRSYNIELCGIRPNGEKRYCQALGIPERDASGNIVLLAGCLQDITERREAQAHQQLAASVFTHAREGITITDPSGIIIDVNTMFTQITGYSREEALGQNPRILQSGRHDAAFYVDLWHELTTMGYWSGEIWNRRKSGEVYAEILTISAVRDDRGHTLHYVALFSDITAIKEHQQQLEHIAHYDSLTGLPNRLLLNDRLRQAIVQSQRRGQTLAVVYLDLDNIKAVNDTHGHEAGDAVLIALSEAMQNALREGDTLARMGGDEFVAVLVDLDQNLDCIPVIERLLAAAATVVELPASIAMEGTEAGPSIQVSASIGATFYPQDDVDAEVMLRHADQAMYLAKQAGKNRYHLFDIANDVAIQSRHEELQRISGALEQDEFVLYYQPKVNMRTGAVIGAEALIRWQHPERGLLPPGAFLPALEDHPISLALGEWVINTALAQMSTWQVQGLDLVVSVNIGALQLQQEHFPERLRALLAAHPDVPPQCLQLEILETSALADIARVAAVMHACRAMGVGFAVDDFGTGYSSLTYLKYLPADVLKIDQSFIRNMTDNPDDLAIVKGVIGLAAVFHRQVIAEGVETKTHGDLLLSIGCDLAQGYGIARPMPAKDLPAWAVRWREEGGVLASRPN